MDRGEGKGGLTLNDLERVGRAFAARRRRREWYRQKYGEVRLSIQATLPQGRAVAVGNKVYGPGHWPTLHDFLFDHIKTLLGAEWGVTEQGKPLQERHPIMQWNQALGELVRRPGRSRSVVPHGPGQAYLALAYDLFVLDDNLLLRDKLVARLKHPGQFQGARYELFAVATFVRAGFRIELENEDDPSQPHYEFTAIHKESDQCLSVECKSKHRPGVLGFQNPSSKDQAGLKVGIKRLLIEAVKKPSAHARVILVDVNLPPGLSSEEGRPWLEEIAWTLGLRGRTGTYPWNLIVVTNHPYHYGSTDEVYPREQAYPHIPENPAMPLESRAVLDEVVESVKRFGRVPALFFEDQPAVDGDWHEQVRQVAQNPESGDSSESVLELCTAISNAAPRTMLWDLIDGEIDQIIRLLDNAALEASLYLMHKLAGQFTGDELGEEAEAVKLVIQRLEDERDGR